jgi:prepilin-type N-terminal cleavage/methylation domain-containing protein/prepilin-type processing-associated H-X9-DG protein
MATRHRGGFTLVELLVVITIIGMLMALLLPAVNAAVEAGRNTQCKNNLRNLAQAANLYENKKNRYPRYENAVGAIPASWVVELLPELERQDIYDEWRNAADVAGIAAFRPYMELMVCPSDPPEQINGPTLSFVANSGFGGETYDTSNSNPPANGVFHKGDFVCNADKLIDGKTYTLCFSENIQATEWAVTGGADPMTGDHPLRNQTTFVWWDNWSTDDRKINANKTKAAVNDLDTARPSSFHAGGVNVAFCDSHVIFLKEDVKIEVYAQLMTPDYKLSSMPTTPTTWKVPLDEGLYR